MTGAPSVRVRDVAVFIKGKKPSITLAAPSGGALPYVLIEGFGGTYKTYTNDPGCVRCRPDDTIVVSDGANTGLASTNHDGYLGSTLGAVRPDPSKVNSRYLFYFVHGNFNMLNTRTRGAAVPHLERELLLDLEFALPPLPEQERIVRILDEAEALRRLRAQADERIGDMTTALFDEMFGGERGEALGRVNLGELSEIVSGVTKGRKFNGRQTIEVPYLRVANVQAGFVDLSELKTIEALPEEVDQLVLRKGDVLLTEGGDFDKLGRGAMWEHNIPNCIHQNHIFRVRVDQSILDPVFLAKFLLTHEARFYFLGCAKRTTNLASINMSQLRSLPVPLPTLTDQRTFAARVAEIRELEAAQAASRKRLDDLFQALLHRAFQEEL